MKKKILSGLLCVAMMTTLLVGCGSSEKAAEKPAEEPAKEEKVEGPIDIMWVTCSTQSEFWNYQQIGMENAILDMEKEYGIDINFEVVGPATEAETEAYVRAFENAIASKPDIIISATQVPDSTWSVSKAAMDQGIIVNFTNCGLEGMDTDEYSDCYNQFYTTVSSDIGKLAGETMLKMMEEKGIKPEGTVSMEFSNVNAQLQPRMDFLKSYLNEHATGLNVLDTLYNNNDVEQAQSDIENQIATYGDKLIGIYGANNISGAGIAIAVENAGIADKVISIGVDSDPVEIAALEKGYLDCIIVQDAYGQGYASLVNAVETLLTGKNPESEQKVAIPPVAVTTDNMHEDEFAAMLDPTLLKK